MRNGKPITILFGRDADNLTSTKAIGFGDQRPYFYAPEAEVLGLRDRHEIVEIKEGFLDAFGRRVTKCFTTLPSDVPKVRGLFSFTCEADIVYDMRYLIDHKIMYGFTDTGSPVDIPMVSPRVCKFDIEVNSPADVMPTWEDPQWPICQIQVMDSYTKQVRIFTFGYGVVDQDQRNFDTEEDVIRAFCEWVWSTDPDILAGWNIIAFDIPYIIARASRLKVDISRLSRWPQVYPTAERFTGREIFDSYIFYKDWSKPKGQLVSYTLKYVVEHETGWSYTNQGDQIRRLVDTKDWKALVDYGRNDVLALGKIHQETGLIEFYEALRRMTGIKITDCLHRSKIIELYLMHRIADMGEVMPLPTKKHDAEKVNYEGALVLQPDYGVHEWVGTTDLKALYPSIILAFNISPDRLSMIPKVIVELMEARDVMRRLKIEGKASKAMLTSEQSLKYVINAFYGYLAFTGARLHKPELAAFITKKGREISLALHGEIQRLGYEIVYGDTDSTFFKPVRTSAEGKIIEDTLNIYLLEWARSLHVADHLAPTLKLEKIYSTLMFKKKSGSEEAAKKRYAGVLIWKDGKDLSKMPPEVDYTGLEVKRSDTAEVSRALMKEFFPTVLIERDTKKAARMVKDAYYKVLKGEIPLRQLAIPKGLSKGRTHMQPGSSPWVRGREVGRTLLGIQFRSDKKPKLLYCTGHPDCICIDDDTDDTAVFAVCMVDWQTMATKTIEMKMKSLIESVGLSWEAEVLGQQDLQRWF